MVPSDINGRMIPAELERLVLDRKAKGHIPFFVCCTSGTTVLGAFDPINEIADICEKYGMWLHVDVSTKTYQLFYFNFILNITPRKVKQMRKLLSYTTISYPTKQQTMYLTFNSLSVFILIFLKILLVFDVSEITVFSNSN